MTDIGRIRLRLALLAVAADAAPAGSSPEEITRYFHQFRALVTGRDTVRIGMTVQVLGARGEPVTTISSDSGGKMSTSMTMDDTVSLVAKTTDDHGDDTPDQLTWTTDDGGALASLAVSADTKSATATPLAEGTVNGTVADASAPNVPVGTFQLVIGPGATSSVQVDATVNVGANAAPAPGA